MPGYQLASQITKIKLKRFNYYVLIPIKTRIVQVPKESFDSNVIFSKGYLIVESNTRFDDLEDIKYEVVSGTIFMGSRFAITLLEFNGIKKSLQIYSQEEVVKPLSGVKEILTTIKLSTQSDAIKLGLFCIYSITLIPEDLNKTIPPYPLPIGLYQWVRTVTGNKTKLCNLTPSGLGRVYNLRLSRSDQ